MTNSNVRTPSNSTPQAGGNCHRDTAGEACVEACVCGPSAATDDDRVHGGDGDNVVGDAHADHVPRRSQQLPRVASWSAPPPLPPHRDPSRWRGVVIATAIFLAWLVLFVVLLIAPVYLRDRRGREVSPSTPVVPVPSSTVSLSRSPSSLSSSRAPLSSQSPLENK